MQNLFRLSINTLTAEETSIDITTAIHASGLFNSSGDLFNYQNPNYDIVVRDTISESEFVLPRIDGYEYELFRRFNVGRWLDDERFLLEYNESDFGALWGIYDLSNQTFEVIVSALKDKMTMPNLKQQFPTLNLHEEVSSDFLFSREIFVYPNPRYTNWVLMRIEIYEQLPYTPDPDMVATPSYRENFNILLNLDTRETIILNDFFEFRDAFGTAWSEDGQRLFLRTYDDTSIDFYMETLYVGDLTDLIQIRHLYTTPFTVEPLLYDSFGISDLILVKIGRDYDSEPDIISIVDVSNGELKSLPFVSLYGVFSDFHLAEDEARRRELSCLFDETLPTQISVGQVTQVFAASVQVRTGAAITDDVVAELPAGMTFEVIRTPECRDGYRWWHVRLSDGTEGFVAEASTDEYFIEPVAP